MQKVNFFLFITLLPITIQTEGESIFDVEGLLKLHNEERAKYSMDPLVINPYLCDEAIIAARTEIETNLIAVSQLYEINVYRFDQTDFLIKYAVTPEMVFGNWLLEEVFFNDKKELIKNPTKIIYEYAKEIGIGYAIKGSRIVVVALYSIINTMLIK